MIAPALVWMVALFLLVPQTDQWPPSGVARPKQDGVVLPKLLRQVGPQYTAAAMREQIEGKVALECVVEIDGTVQRVHVARSLDAVYGLDEQAIKAAKQWRFAAGTKDGVAVPVLITIELTFALRAPPPPAFTWPEGFASADAGAPDAGTWAEDREDVSGLQIRLAYPDGWRLRKGSQPSQLLSVQRAAAFGSRLLFIQNPRPARFQIGQAVPPQVLQQLAERAGQSMATPAGVGKVMGVGQARAGDRVWIWYDLQLPAFDADHLPPGLSAIAVDLFDTARLWTFVTTAGSQEVIVGCVALHPRGMSESDTQQDLRHAGAEFAAVLTRLSIQPQ
jgi:TonB family protein